MSTIQQRTCNPMIIRISLLLARRSWMLALLLFVAYFTVAPISSVSANMVLSEAIIHFEPGKPLRKDIEVSNPTEENLYVHIEPKVVLEPGTENERRESISDPRDSGLLVTPNKIVVPPGGRKLVRLVSLKPLGEDERVYRVTFKPVVGELDSEQIGVKILIGYEVLVLMQPASPEPNLVAQRAGKTISFTNKGNTNVLLREGTQCPNSKVSDPDECESLRGKRLYPGNSYSVELPYNRPVEYQMSIGSKNIVETYN